MYKRQVQSHTETLWRLLRRYHIPTFVFINKMDLPGPGKEALLSQLSRRLGEGFVDFGAPQAERDEACLLYTSGCGAGRRAAAASQQTGCANSAGTLEEAAAGDGVRLKIVVHILSLL